MDGRGLPKSPGVGPPGDGRRTVEWIDLAALMRIESLELRARVLVDGLLAGRHRGPRHGQSIEFSEYRAYAVGDDPRSIDWKLFARTDRCYVRRFEQEIQLACTLVLDNSRSMLFGAPHSKGEYARTLAATLAYSLLKQRDAVGLVHFADGPTEFLPAQARSGQLHRILVSLSRAAEGRSTGLPATLEAVAATTRRRGIVIVLADLLSELDGLEQRLAQLQSRGQDVVMLQILDAAELSFDLGPQGILEDLESGRRLAVDPTTARDRYQSRLNAHLADLDSMCRRQSVDLVRVTTDVLPGDALARVLERRQRVLARRRRSAA